MMRCVLLWLGLTVGLAWGADETKPNVLWILVDDMGYGDLQCYGAPDAKTPRINGLAKQGVRFTQYYANGAECTPTRTALLTGRYPQRVKGLECAIGTGNVGRYDDAIALAEAHRLGLDLAEAILPRAFKKSGYATAIFGKWHLGYEPQFHPKHYGFDRFFGVLGGNCDYFTHRELSEIPVVYRDEKPVKEEGYMTHLITREALQFIEAHHAEPFFLYVPLTTPHFPFQTPDDGGKVWTAENWTEGSRESYVAMLEDMDRSVGQLLDKLDQHQIAANTLVIFGSDHGAMGPGRNLPFRGAKGGLFEGGIRTAMMARWPGRLPSEVVSSQACTTLDFTRSLAGLAGASDSELVRLDGMDVLQHVAEGKEDVPRKLYWRARRGDRTWKATRQGDWKYIHKVEGGVVEEWLFDLATDPAESRNRISEPPGPSAELPGLLREWETRVGK